MQIQSRLYCVFDKLLRHEYGRGRPEMYDIFWMASDIRPELQVGTWSRSSTGCQPSGFPFQILRNGNAIKVRNASFSEEDLIVLCQGRPLGSAK